MAARIRGSLDTNFGRVNKFAGYRFLFPISSHSTLHKSIYGLTWSKPFVQLSELFYRGAEKIKRKSEIPDIYAESATNRQHASPLHIEKGVILPPSPPNNTPNSVFQSPVETPIMQIPVIDLKPFLDFSASSIKEDEELDSQLKNLCWEVSRTLRDTGALLVKDPRCTAEDNDRFLDMMEKYFEMPDDFKRQQERPNLHYQVGVTPEGVEVPRSLVDEEMQEKLKAMPVEFKPSIPTGPDPKWRYMWRAGPRPSNTCFKELNSEPVIPEGFPEWKDTMDSWGHKMISAIEGVSEMAAIGFGLRRDAFTSLMKHGPHLLAPTGSDLKHHGKVGTVFAGYHYDLNFLTIHGRSRFPGLSIWLRNGQKMEVKVPVGCLLIQTGKQIEWLTGGDCLAGMHEVVVTDRTIAAINTASEQNRSLWRVSSTLFAHVASDAVLKPLGHFADSTEASKYPPICAGEFVEQELSVINLKGNKVLS